MLGHDKVGMGAHTTSEGCISDDVSSACGEPIPMSTPLGATLVIRRPQLEGVSMRAVPGRFHTDPSTVASTRVCVNLQPYSAVLVCAPCIQGRGEMMEHTNTRDRDLLYMAAESIRLTREYVGEDALPPIAGWSWFDAYARIAEHLSAESETATVGASMMANIGRWYLAYQQERVEPTTDFKRSPGYVRWTPLGDAEPQATDNGNTQPDQDDDTDPQLVDETEQIITHDRW